MSRPPFAAAMRCNNSEIFDWNDRCGHNGQFLRKIGVVCQNVADLKLAAFCLKVVSLSKTNLFSVKIYNINTLIFSKIIFKKS